ncbi:hypothetical protein C0J52_11840 [Blattella germanica]|nr:hypothetical protein C0J52_11840 [Blattella germanica]
MWGDNHPLETSCTIGWLFPVIWLAGVSILQWNWIPMELRLEKDENTGVTTPRKPIPSEFTSTILIETRVFSLVSLGTHFCRESTSSVLIVKQRDVDQ